jgi:hypothetical protein
VGFCRFSTNKYPLWGKEEIKDRDTVLNAILKDHIEPFWAKKYKPVQYN